MQPTTPPSSSFMRRRKLPALSLPRGRDDRRASAVLSLLLHVAIVMLLVTPFAVHHVIVEQEQGAGGPGPAGGGGGGHGGTGGVTDATERIRFIRVAAAAANVPPSAVPEQVVPPSPTPVPPPEPIKVEPMPTPKIEAKLDIPAPSKAPDVAAIPGVGGGTGHDGTNGNGPGSGGGVGTGTGTGRGAGIGPGTGGGNQENYPPYPKETRLPPFPVPDNLHGSRIVAEFDVDSTGRVLGVDYNRTKNGDYNHRLEEALRGYRFNAGTRPDGRPIRMKAQVIITLP
jgi:hypothetical protein